MAALHAPSAAGLKKFLKKNAEGDSLAVVDAKLGNLIKDKLDLPCVFRYQHARGSKRMGRRNPPCFWGGTTRAAQHSRGVCQGLLRGCARVVW
jgi:hypothetical protein